VRVANVGYAHVIASVTYTREHVWHEWPNGGSGGVMQVQLNFNAAAEERIQSIVSSPLKRAPQTETAAATTDIGNSRILNIT
jgi:hypothetical protein